MTAPIDSKSLLIYATNIRLALVSVGRDGRGCYAASRLEDQGCPPLIVPLPAGKVPGNEIDNERRLWPAGHA